VLACSVKRANAVDFSNLNPAGRFIDRRMRIFTKNKRMRYTLVDFRYKALLPLTFTRPVSHLRVGTDRIIDKWQRHLSEKPEVCTAHHLGAKFPCGPAEDGILINASVLPNAALAHKIRHLPKGTLLTSGGFTVAMHCTAAQTKLISQQVNLMEHPDPKPMAEEHIAYPEALTFINRPADIFTHNGDTLASDFTEITNGRRTTDFPGGVISAGKDIYIEEGAVLRPCFINAETGPVYICAGAEVMEGVMIRGPFFLGPDSSLKMGAKVYGPTTVGASCKVGGEINNSIIDDYSNKGHDGFLGNSVVGSWCNLGADTNISNLKNNYSPVRVWDYETEEQTDSGLQFHGLIMGDHSKAGINTMLNTGTVVGMSCNIYGGGFPQKFIPSFSWGSESGFIDYDYDKACQTAEAMMARRGIPFTETDREVFAAVFEHDASLRP